jgi:hypothetical protein
MASSSAAAAAVGRAVEEVRTALNEHADVVAELFGRVSTELRGGFGPAVDTFVGFFHAVDWKVRLLFSPLICSHPPRAVPPGSTRRAATAGSQCPRANPTDAVVSVSHALGGSLLRFSNGLGGVGIS